MREIRRDIERGGMGKWGDRRAKRVCVCVRER